MQLDKTAYRALTHEVVSFYQSPFDSPPNPHILEHLEQWAKVTEQCYNQSVSKDVLQSVQSVIDFIKENDWYLPLLCSIHTRLQSNGDWKELAIEEMKQYFLQPTTTTPSLPLPLSLSKKSTSQPLRFDNSAKFKNPTEQSTELSTNQSKPMFKNREDNDGEVLLVDQYSTKNAFSTSGSPITLFHISRIEAKSCGNGETLTKFFIKYGSPLHWGKEKLESGYIIKKEGEVYKKYKVVGVDVVSLTEVVFGGLIDLFIHQKTMKQNAFLTSNDFGILTTELIEQRDWDLGKYDEIIKELTFIHPRSGMSGESIGLQTDVICQMLTNDPNAKHNLQLDHINSLPNLNYLIERRNLEQARIIYTHTCPIERKSILYHAEIKPKGSSDTINKYGFHGLKKGQYTQKITNRVLCEGTITIKERSRVNAVALELLIHTLSDFDPELHELGWVPENSIEWSRNSNGLFDAIERKSSMELNQFIYSYLCTVQGNGEDWARDHVIIGFAQVNYMAKTHCTTFTDNHVYTNVNIRSIQSTELLKQLKTMKEYNAISNTIEERLSKLKNGYVNRSLKSKTKTYLRGYEETHNYTEAHIRSIRNTKLLRKLKTIDKYAAMSNTIEECLSKLININANHSLQRQAKTYLRGYEETHNYTEAHIRSIRNTELLRKLKTIDKYAAISNTIEKRLVDVKILRGKNKLTAPLTTTTTTTGPTTTITPLSTTPPPPTTRKIISHCSDDDSDLQVSTKRQRM